MQGLKLQEQQKMETENKTYEKIEPNVWKPVNEGDVIEGVLIQKKEKVGKYEGFAYFLENPQGQFIVFGTAVLDDKMRFVHIGEQIKIEYEGKKENPKGQPTKIFHVFRKKVILSR